MSGFLSRLRVVQVNDTAEQGRGLWRLTAPLRYRSDVLGREIVVPAGFLTDFASVPRIPIAFLLAGDTASRPATVHDYCYALPHPVPTRAAADAVLREAALADGVPAWRVWVLWTGVRIGGWYYWRTGKRRPVIA